MTIMKVIFSKVDLDTCLTGLIMGVEAHHHIVQVRGPVPPSELRDPRALCIECGSSGLTHFGNFDHHDQGRNLEPACRQAYVAEYCQNRSLARLVDYVCMVDEGIAIHPPIAFPSLSNIFSGMLFVEKDAVQSFVAGMRLLRVFLEKDLDPFKTMPVIDDWQGYLAAKKENMQRLRMAMAQLRTCRTAKGLKVGMLVSSAIGGLQGIFAQDIDIAILYNPCFGNPPVHKFTIASRDHEVYGLASVLEPFERGWGGKQNIIGSPRHGSSLDLETVGRVVAENM